MDKLVLFSDHFHPNLKTYFSRAKVTQITSHDVQNDMWMDRSLKDLDVLVNFAEHQNYDCILLPDQWKPTNLTMGKTAGAFYVAVELNDQTRASIATLKNGLYDYFKAIHALNSINLQSPIYSSPDVSELAGSIRNEVDTLKKQSFVQLGDQIRDQIKKIYFYWQ